MASTDTPIRRREALLRIAALLPVLGGARRTRASAEPRPSSARRDDDGRRYILASSLYGKLPLAEVLPQVEEAGCDAIDIWPEPHANQREQIEAMGVERFAEMLREHRVELGISTCYPLGPFGLREEMGFVARLGGKLLITGARGPRGLEGPELKAAVVRFAGQLRPHLAEAEKHGVRVGIENHEGSLISSPDSMRWLVEALPEHIGGIALAPYHLPQDPDRIARLIRDLGPGLLHFYAWQHGKGCHRPLPVDEQLLQMPGRGDLDFRPILAALDAADYDGWTEIFMHPVPRGIPVLPTAEEVTEEVLRARAWLEARWPGSDGPGEDPQAEVTPPRG